MAIESKGIIIEVNAYGYCKTDKGFYDFPQDKAGAIGQEMFWDSDKKRSIMEKPKAETPNPPKTESTTTTDNTSTTKTK